MLKNWRTLVTMLRKQTVLHLEIYPRKTLMAYRERDKNRCPFENRKTRKNNITRFKQPKWMHIKKSILQNIIWICSDNTVTFTHVQGHTLPLRTYLFQNFCSHTKQDRVQKLADSKISKWQQHVICQNFPRTCWTSYSAHPLGKIMYFCLSIQISFSFCSSLLF